MEAVDLSNCDREPIHIPGTIQPHGCLIACDATLQVVLRHSANAAAFIGLPGPIENGAALRTVFSSEFVHELRNALARSLEPARPGIILAYTLPSGISVDVAVHSYKGNALVELQPATGLPSDLPIETTRSLISRLRRSETIEDVAKQAARMLRSVLGYDRVMIYRFADDGSGRVMSEAKRHDLESFLGQHFPASDIPKQARELYRKNTLRIIGDVDGDRIALVPANDASGEPLDLSFAHLRSVSPIHCEYLRNMGVSASMSISVMVGGDLWGLIACHHYEPRVLPMQLRLAIELFGEFFSMHVEAVLHKQRLEISTRARQILDRIMGEMSIHEDVSSYLRTRVEDFRRLVFCDGVGLWLDGEYTGTGLSPDSRDIPTLVRFLNEAANGQVWATHELSRHLPVVATTMASIGGLMVVPLSQIPGDYLLFFRKEVLQSIDWAGNPNKEYTTGKFGDRLTPRKSFAIWKQTVEGQSVPWTDVEREVAQSLRTAFLEVLMRQAEVLASERKKAEVRQKLLNEELNHRVKNVLSLIKSLVSQPVEEGRTIEAYAHSLKHRILALAFAHDQVVRSDGGGRLQQLLEAELSPYLNRTARIVIEGPAVSLDARAFSVMALVLHELATNAAKYGSLSSSSGELAVRWQLTDEGACEIKWTESAGPEVKMPRRRGFGTTLIDRSVPFDLGGESEVTYEPAGLKARLLIPSRFVSHTLEYAERIELESAAALVAQDLAGKKVLLIEDQLVIALEAENILGDEGAHVETAATVAEGLRILAVSKPDLAVLDINLGVSRSFDVADELIERGIPFVFATGYGNEGAIPETYAAIPVVRKPYQREGLLAALALASGAAA